MTSTQAPNRSGTDGGSPARSKTPRATKTARAAKAPPPSKADEIIDALKAASKDKEIDFERLVAALEEAIATAARKVYKVREMAARIDTATVELTAWTPYRIVEKKTKPEPTAEEGGPLDPDDVPLGQMAAAPAAVPLEPEKEIRLPWIELLPEEVPALLEGELASQSWTIVRDPDGAATTVTPAEAALDDEIRLFRSTEGLGRIAAQSAKQVLYQKVREAERDNIYNEYHPKLGELITGTVKRFERGDMIVDLGRTEAVIPREHQSRAERYTQGERVRGVIVDVHKNPKGAQVVMSRTASELLIELIKLEVPEIYDGTVVVRGCVRQPGERAKVAVSSRERDVDPVGACVGMRGARVQAIMRELRGERIDIIPFSEDLVTYAQNALSPAKITRVSVNPPDEDEEPDIGQDGQQLPPVPVLECIVEEDQLSLAIGKRGQNVRLAAALVGARIEIKGEQAVKAEVAQALQRMLLASQRRATPLTELEGLDDAVVGALETAGVVTVGDLLEAAAGDDDDAAGRLAAAGLTEEDREEIVELIREYEASPAPSEEEEPAPDEEAAEGEESAEGEEAAAAEDASAAEKPGDGAPAGAAGEAAQDAPSPDETEGEASAASSPERTEAPES